MKRVVVRFSLDGDFARIGELYCVADKIDQHLRQAAAIPAARGQLRGDFDLEPELLIGR
jgi:hypothetical protein